MRIFCPFKVATSISCSVGSTAFTTGADDSGFPVEAQRARTGRRISESVLLSAAVPDSTPVIAGVGLSDYPKAPHLDTIGHHALAMQRALGRLRPGEGGHRRLLNAGVGMTVDAPTLAEYLGIDHRFVDGTMTGGSSFEFYVQHAAAAIRDGACDTVPSPTAPTSCPGSGPLARNRRLPPPGSAGRRDHAVRSALWQHAGRQLRHGRPPAHARVRDHVGAAGRDRGRRSGVRPASTRRPCTATPSPSTT